MFLLEVMTNLESDVLEIFCVKNLMLWRLHLCGVLNQLVKMWLQQRLSVSVEIQTKDGPRYAKASSNSVWFDLLSIAFQQFWHCCLLLPVPICRALAG